MFRKLVSDEGGYSLVEVIVSIMILAIAILPMVSMFDAGLRAADEGSNYDTARALANEKLEEIKALSLQGPQQSRRCSREQHTSRSTSPLTTHPRRPEGWERVHR